MPSTCIAHGHRRRTMAGARNAAAADKFETRTVRPLASRLGAQQRTGEFLNPTCRCQRTTPHCQTQPRRHERWMPCTCSIVLKVAADSIVASAPRLRGSATLVLIVRGSARAPPTAADKISLRISLLLAALPVIASGGERGTTRRYNEGSHYNY